MICPVVQGVGMFGAKSSDSTNRCTHCCLRAHCWSYGPWLLPCFGAPLYLYIPGGMPGELERQTLCFVTERFWSEAAKKESALPHVNWLPYLPRPVEAPCHFLVMRTNPTWCSAVAVKNSYLPVDTKSGLPFSRLCWDPREVVRLVLCWERHQWSSPCHDLSFRNGLESIYNPTS